MKKLLSIMLVSLAIITQAHTRGAGSAFAAGLGGAMFGVTAANALTNNNRESGYSRREMRQMEKENDKLNRMVEKQSDTIEELKGEIKELKAEINQLLKKI